MVVKNGLMNGKTIACFEILPKTKLQTDEAKLIHLYGKW